MPVPTISNFFGVNAQVLTSTVPVAGTVADPILAIKYSDFLSQDWSSLVAGDETDPQKWITAIARRIYDFSVGNTDDLPNVVVTAPILGLETRNTTLKRRFSYGLDIYQNDNGLDSPDPDLI